MLLFLLIPLTLGCLPPPPAPTTPAPPPGTGQLDAGTSLSSLSCGEEGSGTKLAGGQEVAPTRFPWYVMVSGPGYLASGSVISPHYVLTCGHCLPAQGAVSIRLEWNTAAPTLVHSSRYWRHPSADLGLVELPAPLTFTPTVAPVCLSRDSPSPGDRVTVLGWHRGGGSLVVGAAEEVPITPCSAGERDLVCFSSASSDGKATEGGDSGGVLMERAAGGRWNQVGVHAFVVNVGWGGVVHESHYKAIRVSSYLDWILAGTGLEE